MILDERKLKILRAIIDDYIQTADPVGSRTIARKFQMGLSSATIRNEMSDLEEMGFLEQPHTSAGRIPSVQGYRLYVDKLMQPSDIQLEELESMTQALDIRIRELSQLIRQASALISRVTPYTSMAITPHHRGATVRAVQVVPVEPTKVLVVVVADGGVVKNTLVHLPGAVPPEDLIRMSNLFNERLTGLSPEQINLPLIMGLQRESGIPQLIILPVLEAVSDCMLQIDDTEVVMNGTANIFRHPEFKDVDKAREFLDVVEDKNLILDLLQDGQGQAGVIVRIGTENAAQSTHDLSVVTATYNVGKNVIGSIGLIGPTRMDYARAVRVMQLVTSHVNEELIRLLGNSPGKGGA